ncbi:MAG TPA: DUF1045 domain-containing protein [Stellaceae bacterium]|nr:DUF1045 domain-containing protein [Stellaceae bacterium]
MSGAAARYAVYFVPEPGAPLARFGAAWLGYDIAGGKAAARPALAGVPAERLEAITAEPRRYGFHATLKPPFSLAEGTSAAALDAAVAALAARIAPFAAQPVGGTGDDAVLAGAARADHHDEGSASVHPS